MKRISWLTPITACLVLSLLGAGCGDSNDNGDGGHGGLGDGHVQNGCMIDPDCDDGQKCHTGKCNIVTHMCSFIDKECPAGDGCNVGMCNPDDGSCGMTAANDGAECTTLQGTAGTCTVGFCQPVPACWDPMNSFGELNCSNDFFSADSSSNDPSDVGFGVTNAITAYGNCVTGETAPEKAYQFFNTSAMPQTVTLHLEWDPGGGFGGADGGAGVDPDLDLIVIEGPNCTTTAVCANPARSGGGFMGITAGTSNETVTFTAKPSTQYYVVVDGKGSGYFKVEMQACGKCQPTPATTLACNMSMSLNSNTSTGTSAIGSYTCGTSTLPGTGKEQVFFYESKAPVVQKVQATVSGASSDLTLAAVPVGTTDECNPGACVAGALSTGTSPNKTATISFNAEVNDSFSPNRYFVVVDSQASGTDTPFGLQFSCFPYCAQDSTSLTCSNKGVTGNNGSGQAHAASAWGPMGAPCGGMSNLSGTEYVYLLSKPQTTVTKMRFTLATSTANKKVALVILDAGTTSGPACDPTGACGNTTPVTIAADPGNGILPSTGTYVADGPTTAGGTDAKTAVVDLNTGNTAPHYYWVIVDGVNGDAADFAISINSGCP